MQKRYKNIIFRLCIFLLVWLFLCFESCKKETSPPLSPDLALSTFTLADENLEIELVASEPLVQDPVAITFDEEGRLWVVEMLGFMQDIDGSGETDKVGRISVLFDDDGNGRMDRSIVFLDSLVLPRAIALVDGGVLIAENMPLWFAQDLDGDFVADTKTLIDAEYGGLGLPEHSANGLLRGLDNWYYNAKSKWRYRKRGQNWIKEETEARGQWGITQDDAGRLFYNYNWSQLHGDLVPPNVLQRNKHHTPFSGIDHGLTLERRIFPIRSSPAVNRGYIPGTFDKQGRLLEFTSACGPMVQRGNGLPQDYLGDIFVCEPTANLIRQNKITETGFMLSAQNAYSGKEFLASTDERFRPVSLSSGPDGAIYVVDMYKGIIQHAPYMTPYLREITLTRKLDTPVHMGRIWRIKSKNPSKDHLPDFKNLNPRDLTALLGHPNGWTRDRAQRLLVEQNNLAVVPYLKEIIIGNDSLAQLHALWTLEGMEYTRPEPYMAALKATDPKVAQAALRLVLALLPQHPELKNQIEGFILANFDQASPDLQLQMVLSSNTLSPAIAFPCAQKFLKTYADLPLARDVVMSSLENRENEMLNYLLSLKEWQDYDQSKEIFIEMLASGITNSSSKTGIHSLFKLLEGNTDPQPWIKLSLAHGMVSTKAAKHDAEIALDYKPAIFSHASIPAALQPVLKELEPLFTWEGKPKRKQLVTNTLEEIDPAVLASGRQKYINLCAACHGTQGEGLPRFAPPLRHSEWVTGEAYKLGMILLHGIEGPITVDGKRYTIPDILPNMPSFSTLQDRDIAAIATYIRNSWGNAAAAVSSKTISGIRVRNQGKVTPWTAAELDTLVFDATR
jgi:mono/diheme cytochrome c family protein/glucose/arabinose dehydrogenase